MDSHDGALGEAGIKVTYIYAGDHKVDGNPYEPLPDGVRSDIQARIDGKYESFVGHVAAMRKMDPAAVRATQARTYDAPEAMRLGLIDAIATAPAALAQFQATIPAPSGAFFMEADVADTIDTAAVQAEARTAERARVSAILTSAEAEGRGDLANHLAFATDMTAEQANAMLAKAPRAAAPAAAAPAAAANPLEQAMAKVGTPGIGADAPEAAAPKADSASFMLSALSLATGHKVG